jgi:hypothetical protein
MATGATGRDANVFHVPSQSRPNETRCRRAGVQVGRLVT